MSQIQQFNTAVLNFSSSGDNTAIAGVASNAIKVWKIAFTTASAVNVTFKSGSTALSGAFVFTGNGSLTWEYDGSPHFYMVPGNAFVINLSAAVGVAGTVWYTVGG